MLCKLLLEHQAVKFGTFKLKSGKISDYYVDIKQISTNPKILCEIACAMVKYVSNENKLACMELGAVPITVALALQLQLPYVIIRKEKKEHGTEKRIEGIVNKGEKILIIEDVATTGSSILEVARILRNEGCDVERALVVVDREEGAEQNLLSNNIQLIPLTRISEIRKYL